MIAEETFHNTGISLALNSEGLIAFSRHPSLKPFIDYRIISNYPDSDNSITAIWDNKGMSIQGKEYVYNRWHKVEPESVMKAYFKDMIEKDRMPQMLFNI